ncbi:MAG: hypothetical protein O3A74_00545 [archaeon]|nr:hypothetical protein [archaeon]
MDVGWMLPDSAFEWIEHHLPTGSNILELGSGHGSLRLSKNYNVISIEHDIQWVNKFKHTYIHSEIIEDSEGILWYDTDVLRNEIPANYDLLIIDGPPSEIGRRGLLNHIDLFKWDQPILIDDTHRKEEQDIVKRLVSIFNFEEQIFSEIFEPTNTRREYRILCSR